jgi:hypothetical protein
MHTRIKLAGRAQKVKSSLSVVALARLINISLREDNQAGAGRVPLQLDLVTLEKGLLRHWRSELRYQEDFDGGGLSL